METGGRVKQAGGDLTGSEGMLREGLEATRRARGAPRGRGLRAARQNRVAVLDAIEVEGDLSETGRLRLNNAGGTCLRARLSAG